jgi:DNA-binding NarL/FixJ family response regulator
MSVKTVLLIWQGGGDEALVRSAFRSVEPDVQLCVAAGREGLCAVTTPNVILLELDGWRETALEMLREVRSRYRGVPVLVITKAADARTVDLAYELGANSCLRSPAGISNEIGEAVGMYAQLVCQASPGAPLFATA